MRKNPEKSLTNSNAVEPPTGLFNRIILAIKREQELQHTKRLLFSFLSLLVLSFVTTPLSWTILVNQIENSNISYFISAAMGDFGVFFSLWQDFAIAILESLPITGIIAFALSAGIALFTLRLFLYKKRLLFWYLMNNSILN